MSRNRYDRCVKTTKKAYEKCILPKIKAAVHESGEKMRDLKEENEKLR